MNAPVLFGPGRRKLNLGPRLGKGGEGVVYELADQPDRAVKVYTLADTRPHEGKVAAMIDAGLARQTSLVAFPVELVTDERGRFAGFTMAKVTKHQAIHELYAPGSRKQAFPTADFRFLVRTAVNVAKAVAAVHRSGCVIGDINHSGILVSDAATVALIDADSFQFVVGSHRYLCRVGVPEYTPPELQGRPLDSVTRTQEHDTFGLAIVVFQLLWMGRHPFSGRYSRGEMPIERAIAEHRFAYSRRDVGMTPPPAVPTLADVPVAMSQAFEAAFGPASKRPSAKDWVQLLSDLETSLRACGANKLHHYPAAAKACPWCRMEQSFGVQLFLPPLRSGAAATIGSGSTSIEVAALWQAIESVHGPSAKPPFPPLPKPDSRPSEAAVRVRNTRTGGRIFGALVVAAAGAALIAVPDAWWLWLCGGAFGLYFVNHTSPEGQTIIGNASAIDMTFRAALRTWYVRASSTPFDRIKEELREAKLEFERLPQEQKAKLDAYRANRRTEQLSAYLQRFQIRRDKIKGIGPSKLATLTSYGIDTAYDVVSHRVLQVPGFGPSITNSLLDWRRRIEARFVYDPNPNRVDDAIVQRIQQDFARRADELRNYLRRGPTELTGAAAQIARVRGQPDAELAALHAQWVQAAADMKVLGRTFAALPEPPTASQPPVRAIPSAPTKPAPRSYGSLSVGAANTAVACPRCGNRMLKRTARRGRNRGHQFWGCSRYPSCTGTRPV